MGQWSRLACLAGGLALAACAADGASAGYVPAPAETGIATPTYDWFPATETPTAPIVTASTSLAPVLPILGRTILDDQFEDAGSWEVGSQDAGSATVARNQLTLAVQPGEYIRSLRLTPTLDDFYVEVTARPSFCRASDDYGVLIRATALADYTFALACDGTVRMERAVHARVGERHVLQPALPSGDAPPGAPGEVRIGVWASGDEMRLFLNERFQFSVRDANYGSGLIGVFARASGANAATVSFSDLIVSTVLPAPAATSAP
jgi:hypothetical protein